MSDRRPPSIDAEHPRPLTDAERRLAVFLIDLAIDAWERDEAADVATPLDAPGADPAAIERGAT